MKQPWFIQIEVTAALPNAEAAEKLWDELEDAAEKLGAFGEGGYAELMDETDVIPQSPLAKALEDKPS